MKNITNKDELIEKVASLLEMIQSDRKYMGAEIFIRCDGNTARANYGWGVCKFDGDLVYTRDFVYTTDGSTSLTRSECEEKARAIVDWWIAKDTVPVNPINDHHGYPVMPIGISDIAALIIVGPKAERKSKYEEYLDTAIMHFGGDGDYFAYIVDENAIIPDHYKPVAHLSYWINIYDDTSLAYSARADWINVFRAGDHGCIIQLIGAKE